MNEKLNEGLKKLGLEFSQNQISRIETYISCVLEFNKTYNLMKADSTDELTVNHILDSLAAAPSIASFIQKIQEKKNIAALQIADIGSGGGCPGIPLAVAFPEQNFTLIERMEKRCGFLESAVCKMNLSNVNVKLHTYNPFGCFFFSVFSPLCFSLLFFCDFLSK